MARLEETTFVAMDLETTGLRPPYAKIVEIGAVRFVGNRVVGEFQSLVHPGCNIPQDVIRIHGITNQMVKGQELIGQVLPRFLEFVGDCPLVIHNAPFDLRFLSHDVPHCVSKNWRAQVIDTLRLARQSFPQLGRHSLDSLVQCLHIPGTAAHRALADSLCAMHIFRRCMEKQDARYRANAESFLSVHAMICNCAAGKAAATTAGFPSGFELLKVAMENQQSVAIVYCDAGGRKTKRTITPQSLASHGGAYTIEAFCHLRQQNREFRLDRIVMVETAQ